jgi:Mn-containing catalase
MAVDGGDGVAVVGLTAAETDVVQAMATRTASDAASDPQTGAELGMSAADAAALGVANNKMLKS